MEFRKYQHIARFGTTEVYDIQIGNCYVFPKIDGTNSSVWLRDGTICAGSRNKELSLDKDNAGFFNAICKEQNIIKYLTAHPTHRIFGEWLVPHSLKTYREDAWRKFYVFDVCVDADNDTGLEYLPYEAYQPLLEEYSISYIAPLRIIKNGEYEHFTKCLDENNYLIKDGDGTGEGIVIKNYDFYNKYGRQTWAKIVTAEFKDKHRKEMGAPVTENKMLEEEIVEEFVTGSFVEKEYAKIVNEKDVWNSKLIPMLLSRVFYELINEEMWNILKKFNNPKIDFKTLNTLVTCKVKSVMPQIFG